MFSKPVNVVMETSRTSFSDDELANAGVKDRPWPGLLLTDRWPPDIAQSGTFDLLENVMDFSELDAFFKQPTDQSRLTA